MARLDYQLIHEEGVLMLGPDASTYTVAAIAGVCQATTWRHVAIHLRKVDPELWAQVQVVLKNNLRRGKDFPHGQLVRPVVV